VTTRESIGVGMLGYAFMGKAHSRTFREAKALHAPLAPELVSLSGRTADKVEAVGPHGATFEDGYRCAEVCDAIVRSAESGKREEITYRGVDG